MRLLDQAPRDLKLAKEAASGPGGGRAASSKLTARVLGVVRPFLSTVLQVQRVGTERGVAPREADERLWQLLQDTVSRLQRLSLPHHADVDDIRYALTVFTDETMQRGSGGLGEHFRNHLWQMKPPYEHARGGEVFFERLDHIRSDGSRSATLAVYYTCELLGFHGIYSQRSDDERERHLIDLERELDSELDFKHAALSPRGKRPLDPGDDRKRNMLFAALVVTTFAFTVATWALSYLYIDMTARDLADRLDAEHQLLQGGD